MFKFLKKRAAAGRRGPTEPSPELARGLSVIDKTLADLGYQLSDYGAIVAIFGLQSGYSEAEVVSNILVTTIARDVKLGWNDVEQMAILAVHGLAMLQALKLWKDSNLMRETIWSNDAAALYHITCPSPQQSEWVEQILSDPVAGKERLAKRLRDVP